MKLKESVVRFWFLRDWNKLNWPIANLTATVVVTFYVLKFLISFFRMSELMNIIIVLLIMYVGLLFNDDTIIENVEQKQN